MRCSKPGSRLEGACFSGDGFLAMPSDHLRGVGRDEPKAQAPCSFLMSRDAGRRNAITMPPACMGRSGIHFTREGLGSKIEETKLAVIAKRQNKANCSWY